MRQTQLEAEYAPAARERDRRRFGLFTATPRASPPIASRSKKRSAERPPPLAAPLPVVAVALWKGPRDRGHVAAATTLTVVPGARHKKPSGRRPPVGRPHPARALARVARPSARPPVTRSTLYSSPPSSLSVVVPRPVTGAEGETRRRRGRRTDGRPRADGRTREREQRPAVLPLRSVSRRRTARAPPSSALGRARAR